MRSRVLGAVLGLAWLAGCVSASPSPGQSDLASGAPIPPAACPAIDLGTPSGSRIDLTGRWRSPDAGTYYLRQSGSCVWFVGLSANTDAPGGEAASDWTNSFFGHIASDFTLRGSWADLPWGRDDGVGILDWRIYSAEVDGQDAVSLEVIDVTGGFGGSFLLQPESDVDLRLRLQEAPCPTGVSEDGTQYELILLDPGWDFATPTQLFGPNQEVVKPSDAFAVSGELARGLGGCSSGLIVFADDIEAISTP